ncbi:MAG: hypothetical protein K2L94_00660 [Alphaproteobacteria bacterium]|nr:hypothetical protein [Alphaproteobacteria bacterium]
MKKNDWYELLETSLIGVILTVVVLSLHGRLGNDEHAAAAPAPSDVRARPATAPDTVVTYPADTLRHKLMPRIR